MNVALIGATGQVGSRIATELVQRGHQVTGIVRNLDGVTPQPGVTLVRGEAETAKIIGAVFGVPLPQRPRSTRQCAAIRQANADAPAA